MTPEQVEKLEDDLIDERDEAYKVIDDILDLVLGHDRHEWSSSYGFRDAVDEVSERMKEIEHERRD